MTAMMFHPLFFFLLYIISILTLVSTFFSRLFELAIMIFRLIFPSFVVQRFQAAFTAFSRSALVPIKQDYTNSLKSEYIWVICVNLLCQIPAFPHPQDQLVSLSPFRMLSSWLSPPAPSVDPLWLSQVLIKAAWLLIACGYASATGVGKASLGIVGHLSRNLAVSLWNLGLLQIETLRIDATARLELTKCLMRDNVALQLPFFGFRPGPDTYYDPWISRFFEYWTLALTHQAPGPAHQDNPYGSDDSITERETSYLDDPASDSLETTYIEDLLQSPDVRPTTQIPFSSTDDLSISSPSYGDLTAVSSSSGASSATLCPSASESFTFGLDTPGLCSRDDTSKYAEACDEDEEQFYDPLSSFDCTGSFMVDLSLDQVLGIGSFGIVYRGVKKSIQLYALKIMKQGARENLAIALEITALRRAKGNTQWAAQLEYLQFTKDQVLLGMTYFSRGSLMDALEVCNGAIPPEAAIFYLAQLILAIHSIHALGIIHHDIKLENVMLDARGNVKLIDFGLAVTFDHDSVSEEQYPEFVALRKVGGEHFPLLWATRHNPHTLDDKFGTECYTAPEVWRGEAHSYGVDYFGAACIYHWLITGTAPFEYDPETDDFDKDKVYIYREEFGLSVDEYSFLSGALHERPRRRLTVGEMKNHPLFSNIDWHALSRFEVVPPTLPKL